MQRDRGPNNSLGFGVTTGDIPYLEQEEGGNPESGSIARYFDQRPVQKFFATAGATIAGAVVSGQLVRKAGMRGLSVAARRAAENDNNVFAGGIQQYRKAQSIFDDYHGVYREHGRIYKGRSADGLPEYYDDPSLDNITEIKGFFFSHEEKASRLASGGNMLSAEWLMRDEIQQTMIKGARRLPYELPAAYITQRTVADKLLGNEQEQPVIKNWYTAPLDIVGDFTEQSMKNLATAFLPFDAGRGAVRHGYNKMMMSSVDSVPGIPEGVQSGMVNLRQTLGLVGHQASDIISDGIKFSRKTTGAASRAIHDTVELKRDTVSHLHSMRHGDGGLPGYLNRIASGDEVVTPLLQARHAYRRFEGYYKDPEFEKDLFSGGYGRSPFERMVASVDRMRHKEPKTDAFGNAVSGTGRDGAVRASIQADEYRRLLRHNLVQRGISEDDAKDFSDYIRVTLPSQGKNQVHVSRRITTQKGQVLGDLDGDSTSTDLWVDSMTDAISPRFNQSARQIAENLDKAVRSTDVSYNRALEAINHEADSMFGHLYRHALPKQIRDTLGKIRAPYSDFGPGMNQANAEFLVRRSAERLGVPTHTELGRRVSTAGLKQGISGRGLDPSNRGQMKAYLIGQGDIGKPWSSSDYNIFGFKPLSIQEALDSDSFASSGLRDEAAEVARRVAATDWDANALSRIRVGGMYRSASGDIVNLNPLRESGRNFMDALADQVRVPLIQLKPLQMLGYGMKQDIDAQDFFQFSAGGRHPFLAQHDQGAQAYLWARSGRGKGRVTYIGKDAESGNIYSDMLEGTYRPLPTDPITLAGRSVRLGYGDTGRRPAQPLTGAQEAMDWDPYKGHSLWAALKRLGTPRDRDLMDPSVFAERVQNATRLPNKGAVSSFAAEDGVGTANAARFGKNFISYLRRSAFSGNIHARADDTLSPGLRTLMRGQVVSGDDAFNNVALRDMSPAQMARYTRRLIDEDAESLGLTDPQSVNVFNRARTNLADKWNSELDSISNLNRSTSPAKSSVGIHRQIDELRQDLVGHHAAREGLSGRASARGFGDYTRGLMEEVDALFGAGRIGSREAAQARAAIGRIEYDYHALRPGNAMQGSTERTLEILDNLIGSNPGIPVGMGRVLEDARLYEGSNVLGKHIQRLTGRSRYHFDGFEFDPFGQASNFTLTPTFGTAFARDPMAAVGSALGWNTWNNPQAFSGASIPVTHIFERMNKGVGIFGLGVDSMQYSGPLDMFVRGNIGKRMLPGFAGAATLGAIDRTAGGYLLNERDDDGERIYKPLVGTAVGEVAAGAQIAAAGVTPWGRNAEEMREHLTEGDVAVRKGRFWPLGSTSFWGGAPEYYRPSWYRRLHGAYQYTDQHFGSPMERLMYGYDFSPGRLVDPYRYEEKHMHERPYPVSGEYFTGPWGPLTPALNMTVGKVLKPRREYHEEAVQHNMARFQQHGAYGMAPPSTTDPEPGEPTIHAALAAHGYEGVPSIGMYGAAASAGPAYPSGTRLAYENTMALNDQYLEAIGRPNRVAQAQMAVSGMGDYPYIAGGAPSSVPYQKPTSTSIARAPISPGSFDYQMSDLAYRMQEYSGIYGFAFGATRQALGFGEMEYDRPHPVLQPAEQAYGFGRQFWDLGLGGLGDVPTPFEGQFSNIEISEVVRRFVPDPRNQDYINPIPNVMGQQYPWLPGAEYIENFHWGDPMTKVREGEMRLPGQGYERFNTLSSDETGRYGRIDRLRILGDLCLHPDSEIRMADNSVKTAKEVQLNDWVVSHTGQPRQVIRVGSRDYGPALREIEVAYLPIQKLLATHEHPIYSIRRQKVDLRKGRKMGVRRELSKTERRNLEYPINQREWVDAGELTKGDAVLYPIPIRDKRQRSILISETLDSLPFTIREDGWVHQRSRGSNVFCADEIILNEEFWYAAGIYLAEGCTEKNNDGAPKNITYCLQLSREKYIAYKLKAYFESITEASVRIEEKPESDSIYISVYSQLLAMLFEHLFGNASHGKRLPGLAFNETPEMQASLLKGLILGDGGFYQAPRQYTMEYTTVSISLALGLRDVLLQNGYIASLEEDFNQTGFHSSRRKYRLRMSGREAQSLCRFTSPEQELEFIEVAERQKPAWIEDGYLISLVTSVEDIAYDGPVYNWTVEVDNSFCVLGYATHNSPYSQQYRETLNEITSRGVSPSERMDVEEILERVDATTRRYEFDERTYQDSSPSELGMSNMRFAAGSMAERFLHQDTYIHKKFIGRETALENWERDHVFGSSFPEWGAPIESFVKPAVYKATDRSPVKAAGMLGFLGAMMGATPAARVVGASAGGLIGAGASMFGKGYEAITGDRYLPADRRKELAVEEYSDVLEYTRSLRGFNVAQAQGDSRTAQFFRNQMQSTMYGVDLYDSTPEELERALPKRKREHFREMVHAPESQRERILSTAGRLERRIYQAAWGLQVERRPELGDFYQDRELPPPESEIYDPRIDMDMVKIKMIQNEGLNASQMGYYPQQVREANLVNPSYPSFTGAGAGRNTRAQIEALMTQRGMTGDVREIRTPFPGIRINMQVGN